MLRKAYPQSRSLEEARALEMDIRNSSGQAVNPAAIQDEDLKLYALQAMSGRAPSHAELLADSAERIDANLATLSKSLSKPTYGDLLDAVNAPWTQLKAALSAAIDAAHLSTVNELAERVLLQADRPGTVDGNA